MRWISQSRRCRPNPPPNFSGKTKARRATISSKGSEAMRIDRYEFGRITIDGADYDHDVVVDGGHVRKRKKGPSKARREAFGHTPLTAEEKIPWDGQRLWIGT